MLAKILAVSVAVFLVINVALFSVNTLYQWEFNQLHHIMTKAEHRRLDALNATKANQLALALEITHRMDQGDKDLHLSVDITKGIMTLAREGAQLRDMKIRPGREAVVGTRPDRVRLALPLGKRLVVNVVDQTYAWTAPNWVYTQLKLKQPADTAITGGLGSLAIFLDSGTIIYSRPDVGPLQDENYVLPGSVRMATADVEAIRKAIRPGTVVYFH